MCICGLYIYKRIIFNIQRHGERCKQILRKVSSAVVRKHSEVCNTVYKHHVVSKRVDSTFGYQSTGATN